MARMPVTRKFGTIVKASSVPWIHIRCAGPIAWTMSPGVAVLPCSASKKPWSSPDTPTQTPRAEATTLVPLTSRRATGAAEFVRTTHSLVNLADGRSGASLMP